MAKKYLSQYNTLTTCATFSDTEGLFAWEDFSPLDKIIIDCLG